MEDRLAKYEDWARACMHVRCGFCRENCCSYGQFKLDSYSAKGRLTLLYHWLKGDLTPDSVMAQRIFTCTSCGLCDVACGYPQSEAIQEMKTALLESNVLPPEDYVIISRRTREVGNPYAEDSSQASKLLRAVPKSGTDPAEFMLFFGCTELYRSPRQIDDVTKILRAAKVSFNVFPQNICCGSPARRIGDIEQARAQAEMVSAAFGSSGSHDVVVSCSGCYRAFTKDYPALMSQAPAFTTSHTVQLIDKLIAEDRLVLGSLNKRITYHDPCHLGRHCGVYDEPRRILRAIPGVELIEMEWNRKTSRCCGAGGGLKAARPADAAEIASRRIREAKETGASVLVTACPFCVNNLSDGARLVGSDIEVRTIESLVSELVGAPVRHPRKK